MILEVKAFTIKNSVVREKKMNENACRIGLFWFSKDYTGILRSEGEKKLNNSDLLTHGRIDPIGLHAEYDMPRDIPRGRIDYKDNYFYIWVGEDCPLEDETLIRLIKEYFNLETIDSGKFKIKRHYLFNNEELNH